MLHGVAFCEELRSAKHFLVGNQNLQIKACQATRCLAPWRIEIGRREEQAFIAVN